MRQASCVPRRLALALALLLLAATSLVGPGHIQSAAAEPLLADSDDDLAEGGEPQGRSFMARLTGYSHGSRTASGTPVRWGVVAVDPRVVPLGSRLMIDGFEDVFTAEDTGGAVRGNQIDVYFPDVQAALRFGVQNRMVTVLGAS